MKSNNTFNKCQDTSWYRLVAVLLEQIGTDIQESGAQGDNTNAVLSLPEQFFLTVGIDVSQTNVSIMEGEEKSQNKCP